MHIISHGGSSRAAKRLLALGLTLLLALCAAHAQAAPINLTDSLGRPVSLNAPATRVVALTPGDCEILYAIDAEDTLVGRGAYCDQPSQVLSIPAVQTGTDTNLEQIIALGPQVLLMPTMGQTPEQVAALEAAGITVAISDAHDIAGVYGTIALIGALTGREAQATALIQSMRDTFDGLAQNAQGQAPKTVYFEVSPLAFGLWTAGQGTFMHEVAGLLGLTNAFADLSGWAEISQEQVIARNPDVIVTIAMVPAEGPTPQQEIASRAGWTGITAVRNGAILCLPNDELSRPGPRLAEGAQVLYSFVYGPQTD
ncbi:MAG: ABC transporter substrate-binding protein [Oscillospiraceae bacterium]|jgi:iron complex transport system substrate-binding protein|nr:ABC transporter substrate-binding protein [Oscillospiraceae bacterium]